MLPLLKRLNASLRELRGAMDLLGEDGKNLPEKLIPIMRRLLLAEVMDGRRIIAIGGSQGSGKTNLLCELYPEAKGWLIPNEGRGEQFPVLLEEVAGQKEAQGYMRRLVAAQQNHQYEVEDQTVSKDDFSPATKNLGAQDLLPVLKVPARYNLNAKRGWLLLPGYEKKVRENRLWQELMRHGMIAAEGCIIVADETRLTNQKEIVADLLLNELKHVATVVVISKTEYSSLQKKQELQQTASQVFDIPAEQVEARIVCTGANVPGYREEWLPKLQAAIKNILSAASIDQKAQVATLESLLRHDLGAVNSDFKAAIRKLHLDHKHGDDTELVTNFLLAFDEERDRLKDKHDKAVNELLNAQFVTARGKLQATLRDEYEGLGNKVFKFFETTSDIQLRLESDVAYAWKQGSQENKPLLDQYTTRIGKVTQTKLGVMPIGQVQARRELQIGYVDEKFERHHKNLRTIFLGDKEQPDARLEESIKLLPMLTLEYARIASLLPEIVGVHPESLMAPEAPNKIEISETVNKLSQGVDLGKTVLRSIALMLAADIVSDGELDGDMQHDNSTEQNPSGQENSGDSTEGGSNWIATLASHGSTAVVALVAIGYLVSSAMRETAQHDAKVLTAAEHMLMGIREAHKQHFKQHFDQLMDETRYRLVQALRKRYRLDEHLWQQDRLNKIYADLNSVRLAMLDEIGRSGKALPLFEEVNP